MQSGRRRRHRPAQRPAALLGADAGVADLSYRPELNNDIVWCFGAPSMIDHCSSQVVIGKA